MGGVGGRGPSCFVFRGSDAEPDPDLDAKQVGRWALLTHVRPLFVLPRLKLDFQNSTLFSYPDPKKCDMMATLISSG